MLNPTKSVDTELKILFNVPLVYMQQVEGIKFPSIPGFNINEATDILLKRDFDNYRGKRQLILLVQQGLNHLIPFDRLT